MSRPESESAYLAGLIPASVADTTFARRSMLKGALGAGAALSLPGLLAACSSSSSGGAGSGGTVDKTVSLGSYQSDDTPRAVLAAQADAWNKASGYTAKIN